MFNEKVARSVIESMAGGIVASGGRLEFVGLSGEEVIVSYHQPDDCGEACAMPAAVLQRMLQAMVEAQGGRKFRVVVTEA